MIRVRAAFFSKWGGINGISRFFYVVAVIFMFWLYPASAFTVSDISERFEEAVQLFHYKEFDQTLEILHELYDSVCEDSGQVEKCVELHVLKTNIFISRREMERSEENWNTAHQMAETYLEKHHPLFVLIYVEIAYLQLHKEHTDIEVAESYALKALETAERADNTDFLKARAHNVVGRIESAKGEFRSSVEQYKQALLATEDSERSIKIINTVAQAHNNIGISYRRLGDIEKAIEHYHKNLSLVREVFGSNHIELAYAYNSIGTVYYVSGDYGTAGDYFYRSATIFRSNQGDESPLYAAAINNSGVSFHRIGDLDRAAEMLEKAQVIKENTLGEHHAETALGYANLASIYAENEQFEHAFENFELSLSIRRTIYGENHPNLAAPLMQFGTFNIRTGNYDLARGQLYEALEIIETGIGESHPDAWETRIHIGRTYMEEERFEEGEIFIKTALTFMIDESGIRPGPDAELSLLSHPLQFLRGLQAMADLKLSQYKSEGETDHLYDAFYFYESASEVIDFLQTSYQSEASRLSLIDQNYSIYTKAIEAGYYLHQETGQEIWLEKILKISEASRQKIALQLLQELDARSIAGVSDEMLEKEREYNTQISNLYQQLHAEQAKGDEADVQLITQYRDSLFYLNEEMVDFTRELEQQYPAYYELKYDRQVASREMIQENLGPDETIVKYILAEEHLFIFLIGQEQLLVLKSDYNENLPEKVNSLRNGVEDDSLEVVVEYGAQLYQILIEPVIPHVQTNSLIIVPDQTLHYLPFEMLLSERPSGNDYSRFPFLIKQKQIHYAPSATVLLRMNDRRPERPRNLLAMAPFNQSALEVSDHQPLAQRYYAGLAPLPLTRYETREIAKLFRQRNSLAEFIFPNHTDILLDRSATKDFLLNQSLLSYSWIHFATHAFVNEENPALSGIAFWGDDQDDGILYVNDIYNLRLHADLVVLGACETGMGTAFRGEGLIGFTRAFIHAGAANLVVSMWRVNDQPTADLMIRFYSYIREGNSYSQALQKAKIDLINHPDYASPVNWAAFVLHGR